MTDKEIIKKYKREVQQEVKEYQYYGEHKQKQVELHIEILRILRKNMED